MKFRKGLTLIEVIVSVAILGIIAIPIMSIFNIGLRNIVNAGFRTEEVLGAQDDINTEINILDSKDEEHIKVFDSRVIIDNLLDNKIEIFGKKIIAISQDKNGNSIVIETFLPN